MVKIAVLISGGGTNLQSLIDTEIPDGKIVLVVSNNSKAYGLKRAQDAGIEAIVEKDQKALLRILKDHDIELVVLAGYLAIVSPEIIQAYPNRIMNIHPSLIPSFCGKGYYGLHVHEAAFQRWVKVGGATVHFVNEGMDEGPIIAQKAVYVEQSDTPEILQRRVMEQAEWQLLPAAIDDIANGRISVVDGRVIRKED